MLSLEQAPPISATFRFFLTAPWFGVAAGLLLAWIGPDALGSRWSPGALALVHLVTTGFMLQAMSGALLQFIPVATGARIWRPSLVVGLVHPALLLGAASLAGCFAIGRLDALQVPAMVLGLGAVLLCVACGIALFRTTASGPSVRALRAALVGLAVATILGALVAQMLAANAPLEPPAIIDLHAGWGLGGWAFLLLAGVSFTVIPMFQMTPRYPAWMPRLLPPATGASLGIASLAAILMQKSDLWVHALAPGVLVAMAFATVTLRLQQRRRRRRTDATFAFFRGAMVCVLACGGAWFASISWVAPGIASRLTPCLGILCLVGVYVSAITGMMYKIVPFLCWVELTGANLARAPVPTVTRFIAEGAMVGQMRLHFLALLLLLACLLFPPLVRPAGFAFAASCAWLGWNLLGALRTYRDFKDRNRA